jgi:hypothetical protein
VTRLLSTGPHQRDREYDGERGRGHDQQRHLPSGHRADASGSRGLRSQVTQYAGSSGT